MEEIKNHLADQELEDVTGGTEKPPVQRSNFCRRCRGTSYIVLRTEPDGAEIRECKTCHFVYAFKRY